MGCGLRGLVGLEKKDDILRLIEAEIVGKGVCSGAGMQPGGAGGTGKPKWATWDMTEGFEEFVKKVSYLGDKPYPKGNADPLQVLMSWFNTSFRKGPGEYEARDSMFPSDALLDGGAVHGWPGELGECEGATGTLRSCDFRPAFAGPGGGAPGVAERVRGMQATAATLLRLLMSSLGGITCRATRHNLYYLAYRRISGSRAGAYYGAEAWADARPGNLAPHYYDIFMRCHGPECLYERGLAKEREHRMFRAWNGVESAFLFDCFDARFPAIVCEPYFTPTPGTVRHVLTLGDFWATHYGHANTNFGEAMWVPHDKDAERPTYCPAAEQVKLEARNY